MYVNYLFSNSQSNYFQRQDPAQFLQITGRGCKLHIDHNLAGSEPPNTVMPWQGNADILIDRFDVSIYFFNHKYVLKIKF